MLKKTLDRYFFFPILLYVAPFRMLAGFTLSEPWSEMKEDVCDVLRRFWRMES